MGNTVSIYTSATTGVVPGDDQARRGKEQQQERMCGALERDYQREIGETGEAVLGQGRGFRSCCRSMLSTGWRHVLMYMTVLPQGSCGGGMAFGGAFSRKWDLVIPEAERPEAQGELLRCCSMWRRFSC